MTQALGIGSYVGVPMRGTTGEPVGMLCCLSRDANPTLDEQATRFLTLIADLISEHLDSPATLEFDGQWPWGAATADLDWDWDWKWRGAAPAVAVAAAVTGRSGPRRGALRRTL